MYYLMSFQVIWKNIQRKAKYNCPTLCENIEYDIRSSKLGKNSKTYSLWDGTMLYARYASPKVKFQEEYTLMGTNAIISATGGSLGLFLGFSCFGAVWNIFELLKKVLNSIFPSQKKKAKAGNGYRKR